MDLTRRLRDQRQKTLMALAQRGHEASFRRLYRELYDPVRRYVRARIRGYDDAEDVIAKVFHRFLRGLDAYDASRGTVWTWTMTIARSAIIDHVRATRTTESIEDIAQTLAGDLADPLAILIESEEATLAHGLLRGYPAQTREMFALRFAEGLRMHEIAQVMGLSEAAVRQRFSRTLRELRSGLNESGHGSEVGYATPEAE
jgi:RNA polymerase sigma-70 factor (ECF subfamily)